MEKVHNLQERKAIGSKKGSSRCLLSTDSFLSAAEENPDSAQQMSKEELTPNIPNFAQYLIIGGGTTAMSAFKSIRAHDPTAKVRLISLVQSFLIFIHCSLGACDQRREVHALHASSPLQRYLVHRR